jgi:hypothetical protein
LGKELDVSNASVHRILRSDLGCFPYKKIQKPAITDLQQEKRVKFAKNWPFLDEKMFYLDGMYNAQNNRVSVIHRGEANKKSGVRKKHQFSTKVMVWLGAYCEELTTLIILGNGKVDYERYIREVLLVALKC